MKLTRGAQRYQNEATKKGFTILEVTLVTAFIAALLIAIAIILVNISALYQKGVTLKSVNEVGRNLVTEFTTSLNSAPAIDSISLCNRLTSNKEQCLQDGARKYVFQSREGSHRDELTNASGTVQYSGVFCTGAYSYIWNTFYGRQNGGSHTFSLLYNGGQLPESGQEPFKMIRFRDPTYLACASNVNKDYSYKTSLDDNSNITIDIRHLENGVSNILSEAPLGGFLATSDIDLELYELMIFPIAQDNVTLKSFLSGTFILATERGDVDIYRSGDYCDITNHNGEGDGSGNLQDLGSNFNYCGINKFNFAARTAGNGV